MSTITPRFNDLECSPLQRSFVLTGATGVAAAGDLRPTGGRVRASLHGVAGGVALVFMNAAYSQCHGSRLPALSPT